MKPRLSRPSLPPSADSHDWSPLRGMTTDTKVRCALLVLGLVVVLVAHR